MKLSKIYKVKEILLKKLIYPYILGRYLMDENRLPVFCEMTELFNRQYSKEYFKRMDIAVRYLAIEQYYGKNTIGYKLYNKMQHKRGQLKTHDLSRFIDLLKSVERNGYQYHEKIKVNYNLGLKDGSHRVACAIYFGVQFLPISFSKQASSGDYSIEWFRRNDFSEEEIRCIYLKFEEIANELDNFR